MLVSFCRKMTITVYSLHLIMLLLKLPELVIVVIKLSLHSMEDFIEMLVTNHSYATHGGKDQ
jgi:hypothetical protein